MAVEDPRPVLRRMHHAIDNGADAEIDGVGFLGGKGERGGGEDYLLSGSRGWWSSP